MRVRRCAVLYLEPREEISFDLDLLLAGGDGLRRDGQKGASGQKGGQKGARVNICLKLAITTRQLRSPRLHWTARAAAVPVTGTPRGG